MTDDFLNAAEKAIMRVLQAFKPKLMDAYGRVEFETKADTTVVTSLDKELEEKLRVALHALDPGIGILGEEFGQTGSTDIYWTLDPIDGTEQFIRGIPTCKNLFSLVSDDQPIWALMYMFVRDELWLARTGQGTFCNGTKVKMRYRPLERCWLDMSVNLLNPQNVQAVLRLRPHIAGYTIMRDSTLVIGGKTDGIIALEIGGGPWDYAPRQLLLMEAGVKMANLNSNTYDFHNTSFIAAHPRNFDQVISLI